MHNIYFEMIGSNWLKLATALDNITTHLIFLAIGILVKTASPPFIPSSLSLYHAIGWGPRRICAGIGRIGIP